MRTLQLTTGHWLIPIEKNVKTYYNIEANLTVLRYRDPGGGLSFVWREFGVGAECGGNMRYQNRLTNAGVYRHPFSNRAAPLKKGERTIAHRRPDRVRTRAATGLSAHHARDESRALFNHGNHHNHMNHSSDVLAAKDGGRCAPHIALRWSAGGWYVPCSIDMSLRWSEEEGRILIMAIIIIT